jgi:hypothetical protein
MPKSTLEYIAALGRISCLEIECPGKNLFDTLNLAVMKRTESFYTEKVLAAFGRNEGSPRRESQLGHASTDGEDTAVNQGASKLVDTIRLWPILVVRRRSFLAYRVTDKVNIPELQKKLQRRIGRGDGEEIGGAERWSAVGSP